MRDDGATVVLAFITIACLVVVGRCARKDGLEEGKCIGRGGFYVASPIKLANGRETHCITQPSPR